MLNKVSIMGRLVRDPELRRTQSGIAVTTMRIAVERDFKSQDGTKQSDFFDVVAWRNTAEFVSRYFSKGRMIVVDGRLQTKEWTDRDNNRRTSTEIVADNIYFGDSKREGANDYNGGYGAPSGGYNNGGYGSGGYGSGGYGSPSGGYGNSGYGSGGYGAPSGGYSSGGYGAPSNGFASSGYGAPSNGYGSGGYGAPSNGFASGGYGAPPADTPPATDNASENASADAAPADAPAPSGFADLADDDDGDLPF